MKLSRTLKACICPGCCHMSAGGISRENLASVGRWNASCAAEILRICHLTRRNWQDLPISSSGVKGEKCLIGEDKTHQMPMCKLVFWKILHNLADRGCMPQTFAGHMEHIVFGALVTLMAAQKPDWHANRQCRSNANRHHCAQNQSERPFKQNLKHQNEHPLRKENPCSGA